MTYRMAVGLTFLAILAAGCGSDTVGPDREQNKPPVVGIQPVAVDYGLVQEITDNLQCLYGAGVIPNPQSAIAKLNSLASDMAADDIAGALSAYETLLGFLRNWESKTTPGTSLTCGTTTTTAGALFGVIYGQIETLVGALPGSICQIQGEGECEDEGSKVYFPPEIYSQLTSVYIENSPPGFSRLQDKLDEYPTYVRIVTTGTTTFTGSSKPLVIICFSGDVLSVPPGVLNRLLLGSLHEGTLFKLLERPASGSTDEDRLAEFCPVPAESSQSFNVFPNSSRLGRLANRAANLLMPKVLQAQFDDLAFGGVGGSPEEFSEFGAVDPGMRVGGVGGSPEEFAPPSMAAGAASGPAAVSSSDGTQFTGAIDEVFDGSTLALPSVTIVAPASGNPIGGLAVTFELIDPVTSPYAGQPSQATFCSGATSATATTDATGTAASPCINFGPTPGYRNLRVTFTPSSITPSACILTPTGGCAPNDPTTGVSAQSVNFLIETYEPPSAFACTLGARSGKVNFGNFTGGYWQAWFVAPAPTYTLGGTERGARIRRVTLDMSVTGRSSNISNWPVVIEAKQGNVVIATGNQTLQDGVIGNLRLPGDNGNAIPVTFLLTPTAGTAVGPVTYRLSVASESNRVPQVWYNTAKLLDRCSEAVAYKDGVSPTAATLKQTLPGLIVNINNTVWP